MTSLTLKNHTTHLSTFTNIDLKDVSGNTRIQKYQDILKILANNENNITHNYALKETIRLMEDLAGRHSKDKKDIKIAVKDFVIKAAIHISNLKLVYYEESTARLELILHAMASVLHALARFVKKIVADTRDSLYKSVSKFWAIYRNSDHTNANIMFTLREIRNCLRTIKSDLPEVGVSPTNVIETVIKVMQSEYLAAFLSFVKILDFEYAAGEWYYDWNELHKRYFKLRQRSLENKDDIELKIKNYYKKLHELSLVEFEKVKRKNTKYRNFEYKMLKTGGAMMKCSLPDHIDTFLLGYLCLIQRLLEEFFPQMEEHVKEIISFCNEIIQTNIKKQLTFKAIEILYFIHVVKQQNTAEATDEEIDLADKNFTTLITSLEIDIPPEPATPALSFRQQQSFSVEFIVKDVIKLFVGRRDIDENIDEIAEEYNKLLDDNDNNNNDKTGNVDDLLSRLKEILEKNHPELKLIDKKSKKRIKKNKDVEKHKEETKDFGEHKEETKYVEEHKEETKDLGQPDDDERFRTIKELEIIIDKANQELL